MAYFYVRTHGDGTGTATGDTGRYWRLWSILMWQ